MSELSELNCVPTSLSSLASIQLPSPPPPPPLPPPRLPLLISKQNPQASEINKSLQVPQNELDLSLKSILSYELNFNKVFFSSNTYLEPQLQDGPKCGLVALSIATSGTQDFVSIDNIFQTAISLGFTKQGEMFSADSLALLAEKCCGFKTTVIKGNLFSHFNCIIKSLLRKCLLLVPPKKIQEHSKGQDIRTKGQAKGRKLDRGLTLFACYDADFNHSPCRKRGFKAHWAVISGFVIVRESPIERSDEDDHSVSLDISSGLCDCACNNTDPPLIVSTHRGEVLVSKRTDKMDAKIQSEPRRGKVYLIGRQGKSRHLGLWPFDDMADSNDNLISIAESRSSESYLLPENGIAEGLKGKAIILERPVLD